MLSFLSPVHGEADTRQPLAPALLALAPLHLPNRRQARYLGDDLCTSFDALADADRALVSGLYRKLSELLFTLADTATGDARKSEQVLLWVERHDLDKLIDEVRALGLASHTRQASEKLAKAMHDVRGGALTALLGRLLFNLHRPPATGELNTLFVLARDHLKIMRNAIVGLDEPRRNADRTPKSHDVRLILEKWHESVVGAKWQERLVRLFIDCRHEGALTECCLESAALDRIFYNLANNACRHLAGDRLDMTIFPVPQAPGNCVRFVLSNPVGRRRRGLPAKAQERRRSRWRGLRDRSELAQVVRADRFVHGFRLRADGGRGICYQRLRAGECPAGVTRALRRRDFRRGYVPGVVPLARRGRQPAAQTGRLQTSARKP